MNHATQPPGQISVNQSTTLLSLHRGVSIGLITCTQPLFIECPEQSALVHLRSCWRYDRDVSNQKILPNFQGRLAMFTEENSTLKCNVNVMKSNLNILKRKIILRSVYTRTFEMGCNEINRFVYTRRDIAGHHNDTPPENGSCTHFIAPAGWYHPKSYNQTRVGDIARETPCSNCEVMAISCLVQTFWPYLMSRPHALTYVNYRCCLEPRVRALLYRALFFVLRGAVQHCPVAPLIGSSWFQQASLHWWAAVWWCTFWRVDHWANLRHLCTCFGTNPPADTRYD